MTEKLNIEQITGIEAKQPTGDNPEVISPSESSTSPITETDPTRFNLTENNNQNNNQEEVFSPSDKGETGKGEANTSIGDKWGEIIGKKEEIDIPL